MGSQSIPKKKYTIRELFRSDFQKYLKDPFRQLYIEPRHIEAVNKVEKCRSKDIGYAMYVCTGCGEVKYVYRSCKHRFCPGCGIEETYRWAEETLSRLMKMKHHHVVMTLPKALRSLSKLNGDKLHNILFKSSSEVLKSWFEHRHQIRPGIVSVLHTSGSDLKYHPHVHMIVSGGGQNKKTGEYEELSKDYLVKQRFLGKQLKLKFGKALLEGYMKGEVKMHKRIKDELSLQKWLLGMSERHWIVSIQEPLKDIEQVVKYVGRYTKRACISEYKLEEVTEGAVHLRYKDYKNSKRGERPKESIIKLGKTEFLDRLLQHVPTKGYRMVRYYGQYSSYWLNRIPESEKEKELQVEEVELNEDYDWGYHERYRKSMLRLGKSDPLYCNCCEQDYILYGILYTDESKNEIYYEDSS